MFRWGGDEFLVLISCREQRRSAPRAASCRTTFARSKQLATAAGRRPQHRLRRSAAGRRRHQRRRQDGRRAGCTRQARRQQQQSALQCGLAIEQILRAQQPPARLGRRPTRPAIAAGSSPARDPRDRRRASRTAAPPVPARYWRRYSLWSAAAISTPTRTGRSAARSVTMMNTPWHSSFAYLLDVGREAHRIEADARACARAFSASASCDAVDPRRADAARTACRCRGRPRCSCPRSRRCPDRASPRSGCACSATG